MNLTDEERQIIVSLKLSKAETAYKEMMRCYEMGLYYSAANRLYYSTFYASTALLGHNNMEAYTHVGVRALMVQHFFKTEIIPKHFGKTLEEVFYLSKQCDYEDFFQIDPEDLERLISPVGDYIELIKSMVGKFDSNL